MLLLVLDVHGFLLSVGDEVEAWIFNVQET